MMGTMSMSEMTNAPIEIMIGDKTYLARRLSLRQIFVTFEQVILRERLERIRAVASALSGHEKSDYLARVTATLPSGPELQELVTSRIGTIEGLRRVLMMSLSRDQSVDEDEIADALTLKECERLADTIMELCGIEKAAKKSDNETDEKGDEGSDEKKVEESVSRA